MAGLMFRVRKTDGGWTVEEGGHQIGGVTTRADALDLAAGMAAAIRRTGGFAEVRIEDEPAPRPD